MKKLLLLCLAFGGLTSCNKDAADSAATLAGPTWSLQSQVVVTTPKNGGAATSSTRPIPIGSFTYAFNADGTFLIIGFGQPSSGTYSYAGTTLSLVSSLVNGPVPRMLTVTELTAHKLVTVEKGEDADNLYTDTVTATR